MSLIFNIDSLHIFNILLDQFFFGISGHWVILKYDLLI